MMKGFWKRKNNDFIQNKFENLSYHLQTPSFQKLD